MFEELFEVVLLSTIVPVHVINKMNNSAIKRYEFESFDHLMMMAF